jgi:hypothetical protein
MYEREVSAMGLIVLEDFYMDERFDNRHPGSVRVLCEYPSKSNRRSLHCAPPDFLLSFSALMKFLRLS